MLCIHYDYAYFGGIPEVTTKAALKSRWTDNNYILVN